MSLKDFSSVLERLQFPYDRALHLHGYGEPLLYPHLIQKISLSRKQWPKADIQFYSTLGVEVKKDFFSKIIDAGLSRIYISCYGWNKKSYQAFHGVDRFSQVVSNMRKLADAKQRLGSKLQILLWFSGKEMLEVCSVNEDRERALFFLQLRSMGIDGIGEQDLHNFGDGRNYHSAVQGRCQRLYPMEILQITWDLQVIPCCFDYNAQMALGSIRTQSLEEIFSAKPYKDLLQAHVFSDFQQYPICQNCDKTEKSLQGKEGEL
jgi:hypothetical protein